MSVHETESITTSPNATASAGVPARPPISAASVSSFCGSREKLAEHLVARLGEEPRGVAADPPRPDDTDSHPIEGTERRR